MFKPADIEQNLTHAYYTFAENIFYNVYYDNLPKKKKKTPKNTNGYIYKLTKI